MLPIEHNGRMRRSYGLAAAVAVVSTPFAAW
jgi:hypothetical protein